MMSRKKLKAESSTLTELNRKMLREIVIIGIIVSIGVVAVFSSAVSGTTLFPEAQLVSNKDQYPSLLSTTSTQTLAKTTASNPTSIEASTPLPSRTQLTIVLPMIFDPSTEAEITKISYVLRTAESTDFIILNTGFGGDLFIANNLVRAIEDSRKAGNTVTMDIIGLAASAHAYITCGADSVIMRLGASLLFHQVYGISSSFFGMVQYRSLSDNPIINNYTDYMMNQCLANGRLNVKDIEVIKSGDDVVFLSTDKGIERQYQPDDMTFLGYTLPNFMTQLSNILFFLGLLGATCYVVRRAGK